MAQRWDIAALTNQIDRAVAGCISVQPATVVLCLSALSEMDNRTQWVSGVEDITDTEYDTVEAWLSQAYRDLTTLDSCGVGMTIGSIVVWLSDSIPDTMLLCDGTSYNRVDYPNLYAVLDSQWITDADSFVVPDFDKRFVRAASPAVGLGTTGGEEVHTLTVGEMPVHSHGISSNDKHSAAGSDRRIPDPYDAHQSTSVGGGEPHNNMPPWIAMHWVVVAK